MPDDRNAFPTLPHHIVWSWKIPVADWLGDAFAQYEGAVLPYLVLGDELALVDAVEEQLLFFGPSHLQRGLAIAGGEGPIPDDITEREAHRTAFRILAENAGDTPESALLQLAEELGELIGAAVRERVLRNADALGVHSSASDCNLIFSIYERRVHEKPETALVLKTRAELAERLVARVRALHSYECPGLLVLPVSGGNPAYLDWIGAETE